MARALLKRIFRFIIDVHPNEKIESHNSEKLIKNTLDELGLNIVIAEKELDNIPESGSFIVVSNHPFGGIDALLLINTLANKRPDIKIFATDLINKVTIIKDYLIQFSAGKNVNPFISSIGQIRHALSHLSKGHPLCIFPAGGVSTYSIDTKGITDRRWREEYLKFIRNVDLPVIPIHISGSSGNLFHLIGSMSPILGSAGDLISKRNSNIQIRIGSPILPKETEDFADNEKYGRYLRARTYALDNKIDVKKFFVPRLGRSKTPEQIVEPIPMEMQIAEVEQVRKHYLLFQSGDMTVFCAPSSLIPNILKEIGRLREITFRAVGEGTNSSIDIDEYDLYYYHLFIWDEKDSNIVGAYRVGRGKDITQLYGIDGFYLSALFKIDSEMLPIMEQSLELGRSFIVEKYQRKPLPLFLLWKGILYFLLKHPEYRYLIGPVSISNQFSKFSKDLITSFLKEYYYDESMAKYITPRTRFKPNMKFDTNIILEKAKDDMTLIDKYISDIEPDKNKMPILLKKYLKLNAKIIGFNIDPKFNDALDGLLVLDLFEVPYSTIESLSKEIEDESILERFNKQS
ncbi:MAG TPA: lysophospholipid acyltransferase family protein [Salinivirgaceae bacterium]|nr:lysophospholipid acyltransferase family protein [Salinivirgaceae bacterium]HQA75724.1 lysophospholipid acyltransferase family protein [Salinivirgaceae bacterium]